MAIKKRLSSAIPRDWSPETAEAIQREFERLYALLTPCPLAAGTALPTSAAGLAAGDIWVDPAAGNVLKIV